MDDDGDEGIGGPNVQLLGSSIWNNYKLAFWSHSFMMKLL